MSVQNRRRNGTAFSVIRSLLLRPVPRIVRHAVQGAIILCYLLTKFVFSSSLPEKWFVDSAKMYSLMTAGGEQEGSFAITARLFSLIPVRCHDLLVVSLGVLCIVMTFSAIRTRRGMLIGVLLLVPLLSLGLLVPSKETLVVMITTTIVIVVRKTESRKWPILTIVLLYLAYGIAIRQYYLLILAIWIAISISTYIPKPVVVLTCVAAFVALFFVSPKMFFTLQGSRDTAYIYSLTYAIDRRTAFANLVPPFTTTAFLQNYLYAFVLLHFPFLHPFGIKELFLFIDMLLYAWLVMNGLQSDDFKTNSLAKLFVAHVTVLWLFEPDLGSYFRHFSSVYLVLVSSLALAERVAASRGEPLRNRNSCAV